MKERVLFMILMAMTLVMPANAVLKEKNLDSTLHVLRTELTMYHSDLEIMSDYIKEQQEEVRNDLISILNKSNQNALMLYSQKNGYIFDLTYACHQATEQYAHFQKNVMPFKDMLSRNEMEIARYDSLITNLSQMPVILLSERAKIDRNVCLTYAINIRRTLKGNSDQLNNYIRYYKITDSRLKNMNDYANKCYTGLQKSIFKNGGDNYFSIIMGLPEYIMKAEMSATEKYTPLKNVTSQWDSRIIFFLFIMIFFYGCIAAGINFLSIRFVVSRAKRFKTEEFKNKRTCIIMAGSVITFAIILGLLQLMMKDQNFLIMASGLLVEYTWLLGVILISLLVRLNGKQIMRGFKIYSPIIFVGFLVIAFRIILIPNSLVDLVFPPILVLCTLWQWFIISRMRKPEKALYENVNNANIEIYELSTKITKLKNADTEEDEEKERIVKAEIAELRKSKEKATQLLKTAQEELDKFRLPKSDYTYAHISLAIFCASLISAWIGYTLRSVQILIWWVMQLTCVLTITCLIGLMQQYTDKKRAEVQKWVDDYNMKHKDDIVMSEERLLLDHWFTRLVRRVVLPILGIVSFAYSMYWATDVFNLSDTARLMFTKKFVQTEGFEASLQTIIIAISLFFVFRYICNIAKALWKRHLENKNFGDQKAIDSNNIMGKNVIQTIVWGIYILSVLETFHVSNTWLVVVSGGLSTGIGFAMKDILENIYYGISLMTGRVKIGDMIQIDGIRGKVNSISYTSTTMETTDGSVIAFQNSQLFSKNYKNLTRNHGLELDILEVGVAYGSDITKVKQILTAAIAKVPGVETETKKINIVLKSFGDSSIVLKILVWVDVMKQYYIGGYVLEAVYNALNENNISIPFPQCDVHITHADDDMKAELSAAGR
jgi:small-conductance mechanosensitive channel